MLENYLSILIQKSKRYKQPLKFWRLKNIQLIKKIIYSEKCLLKILGIGFHIFYNI